MRILFLQVTIGGTDRPRFAGGIGSIARQENLVMQQLVDALGQYHSVADCKAEGRTVNCTACQALRMVKDL